MFNGAAAAIMWAGKIQEATSGRVRVLADSGNYLAVEPNRKEIINIQTRLKMLETIALPDT